MPAPPLLKPAEVASVFGVAPKTVWRWQQEKRLSAVVTPGGHRRYPTTEVKRLAKQAGISLKILNRSLRGLV
ncbi:hypothetical protein GCM10010112_67740 [Actinoplanes lobatus]|uniref:Excisionase family DNA binding protein n=1 Tax=Actinoplanes lobatus TaxID=113568 RepID=A0A7W7MGC7_9ACTN|nr:helix-turn-helix domain-containing protein [Actinoplanes lobatus]MBB4749146.1 excisionase family DNA binding protein [Actinoplanes lobatus]GGN86325.1 hypothetical protein GCM10010112_67740 [Actinoplanes lobatus]GIE42756.1 hypothetical protein Alo02nite_56540 [Actinoplanes lobatus]